MVKPCACGCGNTASGRSRPYLRGHRPLPPEPRLWRHIAKAGPDDCWLWTGAIDRDGYGRFNIRRRAIGAHKAAYTILVGPIPDGMQLDHLCRTRSCVNPRHLEPVTPRMNTLRGRNPAAINAAKTHCLNGHEYNAENTYVAPSRPNARRCLACLRERRSKQAAA